jgi:hypothetical protein
MVAAVQKPPLQKLGALDLETSFPRAIAWNGTAINSLLASPRFATWTRASHWMRSACCSRASRASPSFQLRTCRMPNACSWSRCCSTSGQLDAPPAGTSSLRAILYMDEIFFPPTANPPSKQPMLTLLKQARAYGLGCVLATQNPVDLDYKGLGNTGTWLIGRLQTERDRDRLLDGLTTALADGGPDRAQLASMLGSLTQRVFLMRNVHDDAPVLLKSRWALSFLRGPLTPAEIGRLMAPRKSAAGLNGRATPANAAPPEAAAAATIVATASRPALPAEIRGVVPCADRAITSLSTPRICMAKLHFVDRASTSTNGNSWVGCAAPTMAARRWDESEPGDATSLAREAVAIPLMQTCLPARCAPPPMRAGARTSGYLYEHQRSTLSQCDELKLRSGLESQATSGVASPDCARSATRAHCAASMPRLAALQARLQKAERTERERGQLCSRAADSHLRRCHGAGRVAGRRPSPPNIGRAPRRRIRVAYGPRVETCSVPKTVPSNKCADRGTQQGMRSAIAELDPTGPEDCDCEPSMPHHARQTSQWARWLLWTPWRPGADGMPANASRDDRGRCGRCRCR